MGQGMTIKAQVNYGPKNPKAHEVGRVKEWIAQKESHHRIYHFLRFLSFGSSLSCECLCSLKQKPCLRDPLLMPPPPPPTTEPSHKYLPSKTQPWRRNLSHRFPIFTSFTFNFSLYFLSNLLPQSVFSQEDDAPIVEDIKDDEKDETEDEDEDEDDDKDDAQGLLFFFFNHYVYMYNC